VSWVLLLLAVFVVVGLARPQAAGHRQLLAIGAAVVVLAAVYVGLGAPPAVATGP
jgi:hypothetical protein